MMSSREITVATNNDVATLIRVRTTCYPKYRGESDSWILDLSRLCFVDDQISLNIIDGVNRIIRKDDDGGG